VVGSHPSVLRPWVVELPPHGKKNKNKNKNLRRWLGHLCILKNIYIYIKYLVFKKTFVFYFYFFTISDMCCTLIGVDVKD
jgi:hypothetical protein